MLKLHTILATVFLAATTVSSAWGFVDIDIDDPDEPTPAPDTMDSAVAIDNMVDDIMKPMIQELTVVRDRLKGLRSKTAVGILKHNDIIIPMNNVREYENRLAKVANEFGTEQVNKSAERYQEQVSKLCKEISFEYKRIKANNFFGYKDYTEKWMSKALKPQK